MTQLPNLFWCFTGRERNDMVNMPFAVVFPTHAINELGLDIGFEIFKISP